LATELTCGTEYWFVTTPLLQKPSKNVERLGCRKYPLYHCKVDVRKCKEQGDEHVDTKHAAALRIIGAWKVARRVWGNVMFLKCVVQHVEQDARGGMLKKLGGVILHEAGCINVEELEV
jgi:hypothetical protein